MRKGDKFKAKGDSAGTVWTLSDDIYMDSVYVAGCSKGHIPKMFKLDEIELEPVTYKVHGVDDDGEFVDHVISIRLPQMILPEDLEKHVGEVLSFHNGQGYVVTAKLLKADIPEFNPMSYSTRYDLIDYGEELDMSWFYEPGSELAEYETMLYAYVLNVQGINHDGDTMYVKYVAVPTEEELAFREKVLSMDNTHIENRYKELKEKYD